MHKNYIVLNSTHNQCLKIRHSFFFFWFWLIKNELPVLQKKFQICYLKITCIIYRKVPSTEKESFQYEIYGYHMYMSSSDLIASERKLFFLYIHVQMHVKCTCISIHVHLQCMYCSLIRFYQVIDEINSNQLLFPISFLIHFYSSVRKTNVYM